MKVGLAVFPAFWDTHLEHVSALGQRLEPSVLYMAPETDGVESVFLPDNQPADDIDLYLCSVYTRGWEEFKAFSAKVGRDKIIVGGYHPTALPQECLPYAHKVVKGLCGNIERIIETGREGVLPGVYEPRRMRRDLIDMSQMCQVFPDVYPGMMTGSSNSSVGCPYDCDFCSTPTLSDRKMYANPVEAVADDIASLKSYGVEAVFIRDESFATHPNLYEIASLYAEAEFPVLYSFGTGTAMNERKTRHLAECNWHSLCFGLEDVGVAYRKNRHLADACELCHRFGINITLSFIVNDDGKSKEKATENYHALFNAFIDLMPAQVCSNFLMPFPGTGIWPRYADRITEADWVKYDSKTPILCDPALAEWHKRMILALQLEYYYSPEYAKLRNFECGDNQHLRFLELARAYDMEDGGWQRYFQRR